MRTQSAPLPDAEATRIRAAYEVTGSMPATVTRIRPGASVFDEVHSTQVFKGWGWGKRPDPAVAARRAQVKSLYLDGARPAEIAARLRIPVWTVSNDLRFSGAHAERRARA